MAKINPEAYDFEIIRGKFKTQCFIDDILQRGQSVVAVFSTSADPRDDDGFIVLFERCAHG